MIELVSKSGVSTLTRVWLYLLRSYFRISIEGVENIPNTGGALIAPNHSGFAGADAILTTYMIKRKTRRRPRILAHRAYFDLSNKIKEVSQHFGLRRASIEEGAKVLKSGQLLMMFPEGEAGNFKSSFKKYHLQTFHTGFLRIAYQGNAPVLPCLIIGAEESHINLGSIDLSRFWKHLRIPLPINFIPLPAKWKIKILPAIVLPPLDFTLSKKEIDHQLKITAENLRYLMQKELEKEVKARPYVYSKKLHRFLDSWLKPKGK